MLTTLLKKISTEKRKFSLLGPQILKKKHTFFKPTFPRNVPMDTLSAVSTTRHKFFNRRARNFHSSLENIRWFMKVSKEIFSLIFFHGQVECSFDNPLKNNLDILPENFQHLSASNKKPFFKPIFRLKLFLWTCGTHFWQHRQIFSENCQKFSDRCPNMVTKVFQSAIFLTVSLWTRIMQVLANPL